MKIVLDTNVLISGLLSPFGPPGDIMRMLVSGDLEICYDARILSEYRAVLGRRKFEFDRAYVEDLVNYIESTGLLVVAKKLTFRLEDRDDEPFLEVAITGGADFLVTGNVRHFSGEKAGRVRVATPKEFIAAV